MATNFQEFEQKCKSTIEHFKVELGRMRTGRASASLHDGIQVEYYGSMVPLKQVGMVNTPEPRLITVQVYDGSAAEAVERAVMSAGLGLNPMREGNLLRIAIPALTEERRKEIIKKLHSTAEENKVFIRNHRRDTIELVKKKQKAGEISEDDSRRDQEAVQKITDKYTAEIDTLLKAKEKEMMEI